MCSHLPDPWPRRESEPALDHPSGEDGVYGGHALSPVQLWVNERFGVFSSDENPWAIAYDKPTCRYQSGVGERIGDFA
jgi:hypothetical protein